LPLLALSKRVNHIAAQFNYEPSVIYGTIKEGLVFHNVVGRPCDADKMVQEFHGSLKG
jgi:hypothetical protein